MAVRIEIRSDTSANWASSGTVAAANELVYATDTLDLRIGDGVNTFTNLRSVNANAQTAATNAANSASAAAASAQQAAAPTDGQVSTLVQTSGSQTQTAMDGRYKGVNTLNAADYGASVNATAAANVTALNNAFAAAKESQDVYLPSGVYRVNPFTIPAGRSLRGDWAWSYSGNPTGGTQLVMSVAATTGAIVTLGSNAAIRSIAIVGPGTSASPKADGVLLSGVNVVDWVVITGCNHGVNGNYTGGHTVSNSQIHDNAGDGVLNIVDSRIYGSYLNANTGNGVNLQSGANDNVISMNKLEWNNGYGAALVSNGSNVVTGNVIDRNGLSGVLLSSAYRFVVSGNQFRRNGSLSSGKIATDNHIHAESNVSGIVIGNHTNHGANDDGTGYDSPSTALYLQSNQTIQIATNDFDGCTGTAVTVSAAGTEQLYGNLGPVGVQSMPAVRANVGAAVLSIAASGTATATFNLDSVGTYSIGTALELSLTSRNGSTGARSIDVVYVMVLREGGNAAVQFGTTQSTFGSSMVTVAGSVATDGSSLTVTLTNTTGAAISTEVSLRKM